MPHCRAINVFRALNKIHFTSSEPITMLYNNTVHIETSIQKLQNDNTSDCTDTLSSRTNSHQACVMCYRCLGEPQKRDTGMMVSRTAVN